MGSGSGELHVRADMIADMIELTRRSQWFGYMWPHTR